MSDGPVLNLMSDSSQTGIPPSFLMLRSERSAMAPWHQRTSSSPHQAVVYMLHSAVLKGNLWNLRRLSASVPRTRLFVLYDGKAVRVPERVHGLIEAHAQVVACPWRDSLATMSPHILNLSQEKPELGLNGHSFIEPVLSASSLGRGSLRRMPASTARSTNFSAALTRTTAICSPIASTSSNPKSRRWLGHISNVKGQVSRAELQRHGAAFLSDLANPEPGFENHSGVLWSQIIVRAWSESKASCVRATHGARPCLSLGASGARSREAACSLLGDRQPP